MNERPYDDTEPRRRMDGALRAAFGESETVSPVPPLDAREVRKSVADSLSTSAAPLSSILLDDGAGRSGVPPLVRPSSDDLADVPKGIGRYDVAGEIARGGMGVILKARDIDLGRDVALKVLLSEQRTNPEMLKRFVEEAQIGGQLQHPGIVPVHEMGLFAGNRPYFAMKLVRGTTLASELEARANPAESRQHFLAIFEKICQPVAYAHDRGVIHRDLKPSNVMLGAYGEVQVMDWGLAKILGRGGSADDERAGRSRDSVSIHTVRSDGDDSASIAGSVFGTPAYMSPEQARGEVDELDERADVFGLGAILCEILTGKPAYIGESARDIHRLAKRGDLDDAYERLSSCGAEPSLVDLARRCLAFEPRERPRNAGALEAEIRAYLESLEDRARQSELRAARVRDRAKTLLISVAALGLLLSSVLWLVLEQRHAAARATHQALAEIARIRALEVDAERDAGDSERWATLVETARTAQALGREPVDEEVREELRKLLARLESERSRRSFLTALTEASRGSSPETNFRRAFETRFGRDFLRVPATEAVRRIQESGLQSDIGFSLDDWMIRRRSHNLNWKAVADIAVALSPVAWRIKLYSALASGDVDVSVAIRAVEEAAPNPSVLTALGKWRLELSDREDAERLLRRAIRMDPTHLRARVMLVELLVREERFNEAVRHVEAAVALDPKYVERWWVSIAFGARRGAGLVDEALEMLTEALTSNAMAHRSTFFFRIVKIFLLNHAPSNETVDAFLAELIHCLDSTSLRQEPSPGIWGALGAALVRRYGPEALERAREIAPEKIRERRDPFGLEMLALLQSAAGQDHEAVRSLEIAARYPASEERKRPTPIGNEKTRLERLEEYRREIGFELVSCSSIDAALADPAAFGLSRAGIREAVQRYDRPEFEAYLAGRLLEEAGDLREAARKYRECLARDRRDAMPFWRLWNVLRGAGDPAGAARELEAELERGAPRDLATVPAANPRALSATALGRRVRLRASPFEHVDPSVEHVVTRWQVRRDDGEYSTPAYDLVTDEHLNEVEVPEVLRPRTMYRWRVTYMTPDGHVAASDEGAFATGEFSLDPVPFDLSPLLDRDVVINPGDSLQDYLWGGGVLVEDRFEVNGQTTRGLPRTRRLGVFQLASYDEPNARYFDGHDQSPVEIVVPRRRYSTLCFLHVSTSGDPRFRVAVEFTDGERELYELRSNWLAGRFGFAGWRGVAGESVRPGTVIAIHGLDVFHLFQGELNREVEASLFASYLEIDEGRVVRAVVLEPVGRASDADGGFNLFAVTGIPAD